MAAFRVTASHVLALCVGSGLLYPCAAIGAMFKCVNAEGKTHVPGRAVSIRVLRSGRQNRSCTVPPIGSDYTADLRGSGTTLHLRVRGRPTGGAEGVLALCLAFLASCATRRSR